MLRYTYASYLLLISSPALHVRTYGKARAASLLASTALRNLATRLDSLGFSSDMRKSGSSASEAMTDRPKSETGYSCKK